MYLLVDVVVVVVKHITDQVLMTRFQYVSRFHNHYVGSVTA